MWPTLNSVPYPSNVNSSFLCYEYQRFIIVHETMFTFILRSKFLITFESIILTASSRWYVAENKHKSSYYKLLLHMHSISVGIMYLTVKTIYHLWPISSSLHSRSKCRLLLHLFKERCAGNSSHQLLPYG